MNWFSKVNAGSDVHDNIYFVNQLLSHYRVNAELFLYQIAWNRNYSLLNDFGHIWSCFVKLFKQFRVENLILHSLNQCRTLLVSDHDIDSSEVCLSYKHLKNYFSNKTCAACCQNGLPFVEFFYPKSWFIFHLVWI